MLFKKGEQQSRSGVFATAVLIKVTSGLSKNVLMRQQAQSLYFWTLRVFY